MKLLRFIFISGFLFSLLDVLVIKATRFDFPTLMPYMHQAEPYYQAIILPIELFYCAPAVMIKPVMTSVLYDVLLSKEQQQTVRHGHSISAGGFYHLPVRSDSWTFVGWPSWLLYFTPINLIWLKLKGHTR